MVFKYKRGEFVRRDEGNTGGIGQVSGAVHQPITFSLIFSRLALPLQHRHSSIVEISFHRQQLIQKVKKCTFKWRHGSLRRITYTAILMSLVQFPAKDLICI